MNKDCFFFIFGTETFNLSFQIFPLYSDLFDVRLIKLDSHTFSQRKLHLAALVRGITWQGVVVTLTLPHFMNELSSRAFQRSPV